MKRMLMRDMVVAIWTDATCTSRNQFANVTTPGDCYALGPNIKGISVTC